MTYDFLANEALLVGDPSLVIDRLAMLREVLGLTYVICWINFGGLADDRVRASRRRFAEKVLPRFR